MMVVMGMDGGQGEYSAGMKEVASDEKKREEVKE